MRWARIMAVGAWLLAGSARATEPEDRAVSTHRVVPSVPVAVAFLGLRPTCKAHLLLRPDGRVGQVDVHDCPDPFADQAATAFLQWRFEPGPTEVDARLRFTAPPVSGPPEHRAMGVWFELDLPSRREVRLSRLDVVIDVDSDGTPLEPTLRGRPLRQFLGRLVGEMDRRGARETRDILGAPDTVHARSYCPVRLRFDGRGKVVELEAPDCRPGVRRHVEVAARRMARSRGVEGWHRVDLLVSAVRGPGGTLAYLQAVLPPSGPRP